MRTQIDTWLADNLPEGAKVGVDPFCHTITAAETLSTKLSAAGKELVPVLPDNLVDKYAAPSPI